MAEGIVVTRAVYKRLRKEVLRDVPRTSDEISWSVGVTVAALTLWVLMLVWPLSMAHREYLLPFGICAIGVYALLHLFERKQGEAAGRRLSRVSARVEELARQRKRAIEEATAFYTSSEWRLVRKQVVEEQGAVCRKCNRSIKDDADVTVDHIKPRSKFPELGLEKSNLEVLCRRCNSAKGATYNETSVTTQSTISP